MQIMLYWWLRYGKQVGSSIDVVGFKADLLQNQILIRFLVMRGVLKKLSIAVCEVGVVGVSSPYITSRGTHCSSLSICISTT